MRTGTGRAKAQIYRRQEDMRRGHVPSGSFGKRMRLPHRRLDPRLRVSLLELALQSNSLHLLFARVLLLIFLAHLLVVGIAVAVNVIVLFDSHLCCWAVCRMLSQGK